MAIDYLRKVFNPEQLGIYAERIHGIFNTTTADVLVARGLSGTVMATAVGAIYGTPFAIVRKPGEGSHSSKLIEVCEEPEDDSYEARTYYDWLIVDDFIVSGNTIEAIAKAVKEQYWIFKGDCVGIILYHDRDEEKIREIEAIDRTVPIYRVSKDE